MMGCAIIGKVVAAAALVMAVSAVRADLLLSYTFDEGSGNSATNSGTLTSSDASMLFGGVATNLHGAAGSGVTGASGDFALDLSRANDMGNKSATTNSSVLKLNNPGIQNLTSFTLSCWMKTDGTEIIGNGARLFNYVDGSNNGFFANGNGTTGYVTITVDSKYFGNSDATAYAAANTWIFFAVSYDGTQSTNNLTFYRGTLDGSLSAVGTASAPAGTVNTNLLATPVLLIGNNGGNGTLARPFDGWLDNVQIYGSTTDASGALSKNALQSMVTDVSAAAVPESATVGVLGVAALMMAGRRKR